MLWLRALVFFVLAPGMVVAVIPSLIVAGPKRLVTPTNAIGSLGVALVLIGFVGLLWCFALFVQRGRGTPAPYDPPRALVATGPYRVSRNPMYVFVWIALVGEWFVTRSATLAAFAAVIVAAQAAFVLIYEEPKLRSLFGAEYDAYRARVPRWLGWPRGAG